MMYGKDIINNRVVFELKPDATDEDTIFCHGVAKMISLRGRVRRYERMGKRDYDMIDMLSWSRKDLRQGRLK